MGKASLYHVMLEIPGMSATDARIRAKFDNALDWYRYRDNCWILYTTSDAKKWYQRLGPFVKEHGGNLLIMKLDPSDRQGWIGADLWDWLKSHKDVMDDASGA